MRWSLIAAGALALGALSLAQEKAPPAVRALAFSPDGAQLAVGRDAGERGELAVLDAKTRQAVWVKPQAAGVGHVAWLRDGKRLAAAVGASLVLIDAADGSTAKALGTHGKRISALAQTKDRRLVATGADDGKVRLWDVLKGTEVRALAQPGVVYGLALSPDGKRLVATGARSASLWDVAEGKERHKLSSGGFFVSSAAFTPDGKGVWTGGYDGTARLWGVEKGDLQLVLGGRGGVGGLALGPGGKALVVWGSYDAAVYAVDRRPDAATAKRVAALVRQLDEDDYDTREAAHAALLKLGMLAEPALREAAGAKSAEVRIRARRLRAAMQDKAGVEIARRGLRAAALSPDGKVLACGGGDGRVELYDAATGKAIPP